MKKETFYTPDEQFQPSQKDRIWQTVAANLPDHTKKTVIIRDFRSFTYGMAAAVILMFAIFGVFQAFSSISSSQEEFDEPVVRAYRTAISELKTQLPVNLAAYSEFQPESDLDYKIEHLIEVNEAIRELEAEWKINKNKLMRQRITFLYKLQIELLDEIINSQNGL